MWFETSKLGLDGVYAAVIHERARTGMKREFAQPRRVGPPEMGGASSVPTRTKIGRIVRDNWLDLFGSNFRDASLIFPTRRLLVLTLTWGLGL